MRALALLSLLPLAACAGGSDDLCGAGAYEGLVGASLAAVTLPADLGARIIGPDTIVTMDFRAERLNLRIDEAGTITAVYCG